MSVASCPKSDPEFVDALREFLGLTPLYFDDSGDRYLERSEAWRQADSERRSRLEYDRWRERRRERTA